MSQTLLVCYLHSVGGDAKFKKISKFTDLPQPVYDKFCVLCKITYEGIHDKEQVQLIFEDIPVGVGSIIL